MSGKQTLPVGAGCSNAHRRNPRRSKIPLFEEMTYAAMIGQSAEGFRVRQLVTIHVVESRGAGNFTGPIKHAESCMQKCSTCLKLLEF
jgi:hypothetical protein